jgi:hypothetical protein
MQVGQKIEVHGKEYELVSASANGLAISDTSSYATDFVLAKVLSSSSAAVSEAAFIPLAITLALDERAHLGSLKFIRRS